MDDIACSCIFPDGRKHCEVSHMAIVNGYFGRAICYISYKDIQYVEFSQNIFARVVKLQKGEVHLLASTANRKQEIPYISMENGETIKNGF